MPENVIVGEYDPVTWYGRVTFDGKPLNPKRSQRVINHSPDGFSWGYHGSGPAQLALAILLAAGLSREDALALYQAFKVAYIGELPQREGFTLRVDVAAWARAAGAYNRGTR